MTDKKTTENQLLMRMVPTIVYSGTMLVILLTATLVLNAYKRETERFNREMSKYSAKYELISAEYDINMAAANAEFSAVVEFIRNSNLDEDVSSRGVTDAYNKLRHQEAILKQKYNTQLDRVLAAQDSVLDAMYKKHPILLGPRQKNR